MLRAGLTASATLMLAVPATLFVIERAEHLPWFAVGHVVTGLLHASLLSPRWGSIRRRSVLFIFTGMAAWAVMGLQYGWVPSYTVGSAFLVVLSGVLLGWKAALASIAAVSATILTGMLLRTDGLIPLVVSGPDPTEMASWVRVAIMFTIIMAAHVWALGQIRSTLEQRRVDARRYAEQQHGALAAAEVMRRQRLEKEEQLREAQRLQAVGQLGRGLAHLFNNALTVMRADVDKLRTSNGNAPESVARLDAVTRECADIVRRLLLFSRRGTQNDRSVVLQSAVADVLPELRQALREDMELQLEATGHSEVHLAAPLLRQLLLNLILNARDAMSNTGGGVMLSIRDWVGGADQAPEAVDPLPFGRYAVVTVRDRGSGIAPDHVHHVFEPFFSTKPRERHDGLGLSTALGIARQAGGSMALNTSPDRGTEVLVFLPLAASEARFDAFEEGDRADRPSTPEADPPVPIADNISPSSHEQRGESNPETNSGGPATAAVAESDWRDAVVRRLARAFTLIAASCIPLVFATVEKDALPWTIPYLLDFIPLAIAWRSERIGYRARMSIVVLVVAVLGMYGLFIGTFMLASGPLLFVSAITLTTALVGVRSGTMMVVGAFFWMLISGYAGALELFHQLSTQTSTDVIQNWVRISMSLPLLLLTVVLPYLAVVNAAKSQIVRTAAALADAEDAQRDREAAHTSLQEAADRRSMSARLEVVGQAAGVVAHDMNNALCVLMSLAHKPETVVRDPQLIDYIDDAVCQLESLALQLSTEGRTRRSEPPHDAAATLEAVGPMVRRSLPDNVELELVIDRETEGAHHIAVARADLQRILLNLTRNAADGIPADAGGTVVLRLGSENGSTLIEVEDDGIGIPPELLERVFEPFVTTKKHGSGLGLHAVKELVERSGGTVEIWSEPQKGTRVSMRWQNCEPSKLVQPSALTRNDSNRQEPPGTVLLAEDNPAVQLIMKSALEAAGYAVTTASNGSEAERLLDPANDWSVLCIDAVMPGTPAGEIIDAFSAGYPGRPILLCSGQMPAHLASKTDAIPHVFFLAKPFHSTELVDTVAKALTRLRQAG